MKAWKQHKVGDKVILRDGTPGVIQEVHCSYCKIEYDGVIKNHTYAQFKKVCSAEMNDKNNVE